MTRAPKPNHADEMAILPPGRREGSLLARSVPKRRVVRECICLRPSKRHPKTNEAWPGYKWMPDKPGRPAQCPCCHSPYYDTPRLARPARVEQETQLEKGTMKI